MIYILAAFYELIKKGKRAKTHLDIQYFFYLPFATVFTSDDKEIQKLAPYFLRKNQHFVSKEELKKDYLLLETFFSSLSEEERTAFYLEYGPYPPNLAECRTSAIWKICMPPKPPKAGKRPTAEEEKRILEELKPFRDAISKLQN